jgi:NAD(P)-dependent dehydrogenase (short-subunit alcohol dehydrogenase family)
MMMLKDKVVIITGANSGIGRAASIKFAAEGCKLIMACRNLKKSEKAQQEIIEFTKNDRVEMMKLDLSSFKSIDAFCCEFKGNYEKLDLLINNAGYFQHGEKNYQLSPDNIELSFATNALGPFLLTNLLKDVLGKSDDARVLNACSTNIRHFFEPKRQIDFDNLQGEFIDVRPYNSYKMYGDSKMAMLILTFKMADNFRSEGITVNAVQIPAIKLSKETVRKFKSIWKVAAAIQNIHSAAPETMANTYFDICTSQEFKDVTGKLINDKREIMKVSCYSGGLIQEARQLLDKGVYPRYADDAENVKRVYDLAVDLTN